MKQIFNRISGILGTAALAAVTLTGCLADADVAGPQKAAEQAGRASFTLQVPGMKTPSTRAMSATNEGHIETLDVLVFDNDYTPAQLVEHYAIVDFTEDDGAYSFALGKLAKDKGITLAVVANAADEVETALTAAKGAGSSWKGAAKSTVLKALKFSDTDAWPAQIGSSTEFRPIPMYGEATYTTNIYDNTAKNITLTRMLARIDIVNPLAPANLGSRQPGDFLLKAVYLVNRNTAGLVAPTFDTNGALTNDDPKVPNLPTGFDPEMYSALKVLGGDLAPEDMYIKYDIASAAGSQSLSNTIYAFESLAGTIIENNTKEDVKYMDVTRLLLEGEYTDADGKTVTYWYPVDFTRQRDADTGMTDFMPLLRNHRYVVNIQETGSGYPQEHFNNLTALISATELSNLKTSVLSYNEGLGGQIFHTGQYFAVLDATDLTVTKEQQIVNVRMYTDYPFGGTMAVVNPTSTKWLGISRNHDSGVLQQSKSFNAHHGSGDGVELITVCVDAYAGTTQRQGLIRIELGDMVILLTVTQSKDSSYYLRLTDENGNEIDELNFNYGIGLDEVPSQRVYLTWNLPADCTVTETPDETYPFVYATGTESPDGSSVSGGATWFDIQPEVGLESDRFITKSSVLTFAATDGNNDLSCDLTLNQQEDFASVTPAFSVTGPAAFTYGGGSEDYSVTSNVTGVLSEGGSIVSDIAWTAKFSTDGGTTWTDDVPEWLTGFTTSGPGGAATTYTATTEAFTGVTTNTEDLALKNATAKGSAATPYDLATGNTRVLEDMNTANCYIINAPGHYRLPLVYGNAIKDGNDNDQAYKPTGTSSGTFLTPFVNHLDEGITDPYLYNNAGVEPHDATLVWMDAPGLVANVALDEDQEYLTFEIPADYIEQGNAIVAVRDQDGTVLWSWHIWVTPLVPMNKPGSQAEIGAMTDATVNYDNITTHFMKYDLGWSTAKTVIYGTTDLSVQVRITQTGIANPGSQTFTVTQNKGTVTTGVNSTYYQFGRKDPMPPSTGLTSIDKTLYGGAYVISAGPTSLGSVIANPNHFYTNNSSNWCSSSAYNLWSATNTVMGVNNNAVVKTIYDPSPVGFSMPASAAWTGFTTTGNNVTTGLPTNCNVDGTFAQGWSFWLDPDKSVSLFYPAMGIRLTNGKLTGVRGEGGYWSAIPYNSAESYKLSYYYSGIRPRFYSYKALGITVRCAAEPVTP